MGGCRCSFQKCENSTSNSVGMHFFHYPYKQVDRVQKWINNSSNLDFFDMPANKLRNKVVCEVHFKSSCFMNYKKESLVKTAIPTLVKLESGEIIDLESSTIEIEMLEEEKSDYSDVSPSKPRILNNRKNDVEQNIIDLMPDISKKDLFLLDVNTAGNQLIENEIHEAKKRKMEILENIKVNVPVKKVINNVIKYSVQKPTVLNSLIKKDKSPTPPATKLLNSGVTLTKLKTVSKKPFFKKCITQPEIEIPTEIVSYIPEPIKTDPVPEFEEELELSESKSQPDLLESTSNVVVKEKIPAQPLISQETIDKEFYVQTMSDQAKQIEELKTLMKEMIVKNSETTQTITKKAKTETSPKVSKSNLNKVQLFNGIKRYLNPSMVSLLRMEMFGGNEREWKSDEKDFSIELLNLGSSVYEYMQDEWRFRLPPKKEVEKWKIDKGDDSDMDDC